MKIKEFNNLFIDEEQYIRLYDIHNDDEVCFEGQIKEMPKEFYKRRIILIETQYEEYFDGYLGIFISTSNEDECYKEYHDEDENE